MSADAEWFAVRTRSRAEKKAARLLEARSIEAYCPVVERERRWADRTKRVDFPLFPGYLFARFHTDALLRVLQVPGVAGVVRSEGVPVPVRPDEMESVRVLERGIAETGQEPHPADFLEPGDEVRVVGGPFVGMTGILAERRGSARVAVRLTAIRQAVAVELPREMLELLVGSSSSSSSTP